VVEIKQGHEQVGLRRAVTMTNLSSELLGRAVVRGPKNKPSESAVISNAPRDPSSKVMSPIPRPPTPWMCQERASEVTCGCASQ
jgi:hypothetical protein